MIGQVSEMYGGLRNWRMRRACAHVSEVYKGMEEREDEEGDWTKCMGDGRIGG